jgi:hypothetical protein
MRHLTKTAISAVLLLSSIAGVAGCDIRATAQTPPPAPKPIDLGRVEAGKYVNDFFGLSLSIPQGWAVQGAFEKRVIVEYGKQTLETNADERKKVGVEADLARSAFLLSLTKYPLYPPPTDFNAHFALVAERIPTAVVKTGSDYFDAMLRTAQGSGAKLEPRGPVRSLKLGGVAFSVMDAKVTVTRGVVAAKFYVTLRKGYAFLFTFEYNDEDDAQSFEGIMNSVRFK